MGKTSTQKKVVLLGASFNTGNMGVSALGESSIKCILHRWPDAEISIMGGTRTNCELEMEIGKRKLKIWNFSVRFSKKIFQKNHFVVLFIYGIFLKIIRFTTFRQFCERRNEYVREISNSDLVADITGGDSFSDIYGMKRFLIGLMHKWLVLLYKKPLVFLPQTYGPFKRSLARFLSKRVLRKARLILSRDREGIRLLTEMLGSKKDNLRLVPDVAFVLDPRPPGKINIGMLENMKKSDTVVVGLNISGLLYNGGYSGSNMFDLKTDYRSLVKDIIARFMEYENVFLLLVPHVFPPAGLEVESDADACLQVFKAVSSLYKDRIFLASGDYDHREIKHVIGRTDFFLGSRMHACIAALSQSIPALGLAYSKKFSGVFETAGVDHLVADMRTMTGEEILRFIKDAFDGRGREARSLQKQVPVIKEKVIGVFNAFSD